MQKEFEAIYHEVEKEHFWFRARRKYICDLVDQYPRSSSILDIGSSSGILLNELADMGFEKDNLFGIDISEAAIENCKKNGIKNCYLMDAGNISLDRKFDIIIASDCLEHIENDRKALTDWSNLLSASGVLIVFVPAFMSLWSSHDEANMHFKRYKLGQLRSIISDTGLQIERASYWNFFLFLPVLIARIINRILQPGKGSSSDLKRPGLMNGLLLKLLLFENRILRVARFPFGISAFCIARPKLHE
jgi:SAM-dependent methyltransferase